MFTPREDILFDYRILFRWVGKKPPTSYPFWESQKTFFGTQSHRGGSFESVLPTWRCLEIVFRRPTALKNVVIQIDPQDLTRMSRWKLGSMVSKWLVNPSILHL